MVRGYYIDLSSISLEEFMKKLGSAYLPPSRMLLKERLGERFDHFRSLGISNVQELQKILKKKAVLLELSREECFTEQYLLILLREINSMHPRPNKIRDFPGISQETIARLKKTGIKDTLALFDKVKDQDSINDLTISTGVSESDIRELSILTDLSRIKWVGANFARILYECGIHSLEMAAGSRPEELHENINRINRDRNFYKGKIGLNDIRILIQEAGELKRRS